MCLVKPKSITDVPSLLTPRLQKLTIDNCGRQKSSLIGPCSFRPFDFHLVLKTENEN